MAAVPAAVAAGHPATADAGLRVLAEGGNAADAAVAAVLASCVAETVMTGLAGGGFALWWDARRRSGQLVDFFVTTPGLEGGAREPHVEHLDIAFGTQPVRYAVGIGSVAVPGVPAGCELLSQRWGRLPWRLLVEPALSLARDGVPMPPAHARTLRMVADVLTCREGAGIYAPGGRLLVPGQRLRQPGLVHALELLRDEGAATFYRGTVAGILLELMRERGGLVTAADLDAYRPVVTAPVGVEYVGVQLLSRRDLGGMLDVLAGLPRLRGRSPAERALALVAALDVPGPEEELPEDTTNITVVDAEQNACVVTTSLGLGSGDFLPGLDIHLNSMLGEEDLLRGHVAPGGRMDSMMAPTVVIDGGQLVLGAGAAGGSRIRSALVQVLAGVLDEGLAPREAVERPRLHPHTGVVHLEPGLDDAVAPAVEAAGYEVRRWDTRHHYFGGASAVGLAGAGADPRRDGAALLLHG
jgi:gamma-glutamyltranspeptidase/glutathione hydrolase